MAVEVTCVRDYGGEMVKELTGGRGTEFYVVDGCSRSELLVAQAAGLPIEGFPHPDPRFFYVGNCKRVGFVRSWAPLTWLAIVQYSTGGSIYSLSTRLGSEEGGETTSYPVPCLTHLGVGPLAPPFAKWYVNVPRYKTTRIESRIRNGIIEADRALAKRNIGKLYSFASLWTPNPSGIGVFNTTNTYILEDVRFRDDPLQNGRIDTKFASWGQIKAYPEYTLNDDQEVAIPALPENCTYSASTTNGTYTILNPRDSYGIGETLPWL